MNFFRKPQTIYIWLFFGLVTFYFIWVDNASIFAARYESTEKAENIFALLFSDKTYQIVFPILFYNIPHQSVRKSIVYYIFVVLLFFLLNLSSTSKATILQIFTFFFLSPLAFYYTNHRLILWPQKKLFLLGSVIAIPLFIFSMLSREFLTTGRSISFSGMLDIFVNMGDFDLGIVFGLIFERLAAMMNNFVLLFAEFSTKYDIAYSLHFLKYWSSSLMNLVLPGTPFPDSYVLTSQLFPKVLEHAQLESGLDRVTLLQQANTQPYSLFGFLLIIFSPVPTLFICFILGFLFSVIYNFLREDYTKVIMMFSFGIFFHGYGIEAGIQSIVLLLVTTFILVFIMKLFDRVKI